MEGLCALHARWYLGQRLCCCEGRIGSAPREALVGIGAVGPASCSTELPVRVCLHAEKNLPPVEMQNW